MTRKIDAAIDALWRTTLYAERELVWGIERAMLSAPQRNAVVKHAALLREFRAELRPLVAAAKPGWQKNPSESTRQQRAARFLNDFYDWASGVYDRQVKKLHHALAGDVPIAQFSLAQTYSVRRYLRAFLLARDLATAFEEAADKLWEPDVRENPPKDYSFYTTCVDSPDGQLISDMTEQAQQVTYETMLAHARGMLDVAEQLNYERRSTSGHGLTLKNDWHVGYFKSTYAGCPCYYFVWSAIEHIWVKNDCQPRERRAKDVSAHPEEISIRALNIGTANAEFALDCAAADLTDDRIDTYRDNAGETAREQLGEDYVSLAVDAFDERIKGL